MMPISTDIFIYIGYRRHGTQITQNFAVSPSILVVTVTISQKPLSLSVDPDVFSNSGASQILTFRALKGAFHVEKVWDEQKTKKCIFFTSDGGSRHDGG